MQHAVRDEVGVAADRGGEVQIELRLEAVMADALIRIARAGERAQQQGGQHALLRVVLRAAQHDLELGGVLGLGRVDAVAERARELRERAQLVRVGVFVHAVDRRVLALAHELRDRLVGLKHEFLEDLIGLVVRHARLGADDGFGEARAEAAAACIHLHERGEGETVDVRVERADAVGQRERQHGHDVTGEVDRGAAAERL